MPGSANAAGTRTIKPGALPSDGFGSVAPSIVVGAGPVNRTEVKLELPPNGDGPKAERPIDATLDPNVTDVSRFPRNAVWPMVLTESGISTEERLLFSKAPAPISVTELPSLTEAILLPMNALSPMEVTESGTISEVSEL